MSQRLPEAVAARHEAATRQMVFIVESPSLMMYALDIDGSLDGEDDYIEDWISRKPG